MKSKIAIFASGQGSNAARLLQHFEGNEHIEIDCLVCNRKDAGVYQLAKDWQKSIYYFPKESFLKGEEVLEQLKQRRIDWIVLAGFLLKMPEGIIRVFENRIINIHPALLPKFGGKGMYGNHVHAAVLESREEKSGISIHYVDGNYDTGSLIAQFDCPVLPTDSLDDLKARVQQLEHKYFPGVIEELIVRKSEDRIQ